jgi:hypothetical protein
LRRIAADSRVRMCEANLIRRARDCSAAGDR